MGVLLHIAGVAIPPSFSMWFKPGGVNGWYPDSTITGEQIGTGDGASKNYNSEFGYIRPGWSVYLDGVKQVSGVSVDEDRLTWKVSPSVPWYSVLRVVDSDGNPLPCNAPAVPCPKIDKSATTYWENTEHGKVGVVSIWGSSENLYASDDLETWDTVYTTANTTGWKPVPEALRYKRYFKATDCERMWTSVYLVYQNNYNIHFDTPPTEGAIITMDCTTPVIPKNKNNVFDFSFTIQLGEYTPE